MLTYNPQNNSNSPFLTCLLMVQMWFILFCTIACFRLGEVKVCSAECSVQFPLIPIMPWSSHKNTATASMLTKNTHHTVCLSHLWCFCCCASHGGSHQVSIFMIDVLTLFR